jgi:hypothetical protein
LSLLDDENKDVFHLDLDRTSSSLAINDTRHQLPAETMLTDHHQFRILKLEGMALCYFDDVLLGEFEVRSGPLSPAVTGSRFAIEMVRLTVI